MKQLAEIYTNTNSTSTVQGSKTHNNYSEACEYLKELGYEFGSEGKGSSGNIVERWWKESEVAAPVAIEVAPAQEWANTYGKGDTSYKACPCCKKVNIKVNMNCCLDCVNISQDGNFIATVTRTGKFYGHKGYKYNRYA